MKWLRKIIFGKYIWTLEQQNEQLKKIILEDGNRLQYRDHVIAELKSALEETEVRAFDAEHNFRKIAETNDCLQKKIQELQRDLRNKAR